jgi:hypothetical protein
MSAFALTVVSDRPLAGMVAGAPPTVGSIPVVLSFAARAEVEAACTRDPATPVWEVILDDLRCFLEVGRGGDHRFRYGDRAIFVITGDTTAVHCGMDDPDDPWCQRVLLDTVLFTIALIRGNEALHGGAVEVAGEGIAVTGGTGSGKTTVIASLIRHGARFVSDDILVLDRSRPHLVVPGPPLMNSPLRTSGALVPRHAMSVARLGDEDWLRIGDVATREVPIRSLFLLTRGNTATTTAEQIEATSLHLLPEMLAFGHLSDRVGPRFEAAGEVASHASVFALRVAEGASPDDLADLVLAKATGSAPPQDESA